MPSLPIIHRPSQTVLIPYDQIQGLFPDTPTIDYEGVRWAVLPHDPYTQVKLRAVDVDIPAPILHHYDWKSADRLVPFKVQRLTAALATSWQRAYILNDLGTGKTRAALWAWRYLHMVGMSKKLLVVAPLSTIRFTWAAEAAMSMPDIKVAVLHGTRKQREALLASDADIYVINHHGLRILEDDIAKRDDIDCMVIDELAVYRNNSQRSKAMRKFAQHFTWVWGMTGRPMPQSPVDVWGQCKIITPQNVPKYYTHAKTALMQQVGPYAWVQREGAKELAFSWMQPAVRFSLDDVTELPEAIYRFENIAMTDEQQFAYRHMANEFAVMVNSERIVAANAGVALGKLLQIAAGYVYSTNPDYLTLDSAPRQQRLLELIDEASDAKIIVFANWRHLIDNLSELLKKEDIEHAVIHGDVKDRERSHIFSDFQNTSKYRVLLAHPQTMAHGVTLTAAATMIWYGPVPSLDIYEQACARIRRPSQKKKQLYIHFQATGAERRIYTLLRQRAKMQNAFLDMLRDATKEGARDNDSLGHEQSGC